jgi:hypothetical protein
MNFKGVIIEEGLHKKEVLTKLNIVTTQVEKVTAQHKTPWLKQWTLHTVEIPMKDVDDVAKQLSHALEPGYWYADFKNDHTHFVIFSKKVFRIDRSRPEDYGQVVSYGLGLGIPKHQLDFSPAVEQWKRYG